MELTKQGEPSKKKDGNEIICKNCGAEHKITISDVIREIIPVGRYSYRQDYYYFCSWCNEKIFIEEEKMEKLRENWAFNVVKNYAICSNAECKVQVELLPSHVSKIREGFMRYSKERLWVCPKCNQENRTHKSNFSTLFNERITKVVKRKD